MSNRARLLETTVELIRGRDECSRDVRVETAVRGFEVLRQFEWCVGRDFAGWSVAVAVPVIHHLPDIVRPFRGEGARGKVDLLVRPPGPADVVALDRGHAVAEPFVGVPRRFRPATAAGGAGRAAPGRTDMPSLRIIGSS